MTQRLKKTYPKLSVLSRNPGVCYVVGISSVDMVELVTDEVMLIRHKDPMTLIDGKLMSRHKGMTFERERFEMHDEDFLRALQSLKDHFG